MYFLSLFESLFSRNTAILLISVAMTFRHTSRIICQKIATEMHYSTKSSAWNCIYFNLFTSNATSQNSALLRLRPPNRRFRYKSVLLINRDIGPKMSFVRTTLSAQKQLQRSIAQPANTQWTSVLIKFKKAPKLLRTINENTTIIQTAQFFPVKPINVKARERYLHKMFLHENKAQSPKKLHRFSMNGITSKRYPPAHPKHLKYTHHTHPNTFSTQSTVK